MSLLADGVLPGSLSHLDLLYMSTQQTSTQAGESFAALFAESIEKQDMKSGEVIAWLMDMLETSAHARANWTGNQS